MKKYLILFLIIIGFGSTALADNRTFSPLELAELTSDSFKIAKPGRPWKVEYSDTSASLATFPVIGIGNTHISEKGINDFSFSALELAASGRNVIGELFADRSAFNNDGLPDLFLRTATNHPLLFGTNGEERMRITSDGAVII